MSGPWYEVARNPAPDVYCVKVDAAISPDNSTLFLVNTTYADSSSYLYINQTVNGNISLAGLTLPSTDGYNISYSVGYNTYQPSAIYKLLATDNDNYALICGYTNAADLKTEFGIVLARNRNISNFNNTQLDIYEQMGFNMTTAFLNGSMALVTQSEG